MASTNPFDLLVDDDNDDPTLLLAKLHVAVATTKKIPVGGAAAKLPSKPLPPAPFVREAKTDGQRGGGRSGGRGGGRGFNRESFDNENSNNNGFSGGYRQSENGDAVDRLGPRSGYRGVRRGGYSNGDAAESERPRRVYERHSGTGRGNGFKREGAGRGNWGTTVDEVAPATEEGVTETEKVVESEKQEEGVDVKVDPVKEKERIAKEKEREAKEKEREEREKERIAEAKKMTLEQYEKVLEEKRKALEALKSEERKVGLDKDLAKMQLLSNKKNEEDIFVKLGSEKDKRKEAADKEEKAKKSVIIDVFPKSNGRGRGRGGRGGFRGGYVGGGESRMNNVIAPSIEDGESRMNNVIAPSIEDVAQFPSLSVK